MRALVLNDTRRGGHLGCTLVMAQLFAGCDAAGIGIGQVLSLGRSHIRAVHGALPSHDVVIINGEGTMHHDRPGACMLAEAGILAHKAGKPLVLLNTVWEQNNIVGNLLPCASLIYARESLSAESICRAGFPARVVPDLSLCSAVDAMFPAPALVPGPVVVLDDVRWDLAMLLAGFAERHGFQFFRMAGRPSWRCLSSMWDWGRLFWKGDMRAALRWASLPEIQKAEIIVTGRFHGACMAVLAGRPFLALPSNTYKIQGMLRDADLGVCARMLDADGLTANGLAEAVMEFRNQVAGPGIQRAYKEACHRYVKRAKMDAKSMFHSIAALA